MYSYETTLTHLVQTTDSSRAIARLKAMVGAKDFVKDDRFQTIRFKFSGFRKGNICIIKLNSNDLYDLTIGKVFKGEWIESVVVTDIYAENLRSVFESKTGLYLSASFTIV